MSRDIFGPTQPNTGSTARDHLANERTYLAWHRTGISVAALGVAVAKFAPHRGDHAIAAGFILVAAGLLVSAYGTYRYRVISRQLESGVFAPATFTAVVTSSIVTLLALLAVLVLL